MRTCTSKVSSRSQSPLDVLDDSISSLIKRKAKSLSRAWGFNSDEAEDIAQELTLHLFEKRDKFDPSRASSLGYAKTLIERKIISIVRYRRAQCRDPRREQFSLDMSIRDADGKQIAGHETIALRGPSAFQEDARRDVAAITVGLPIAAAKEVNRLLRSFTNGERSRARKPVDAVHDVLWREFAPLRDDVPPVRIEDDRIA